MKTTTRKARQQGKALKAFSGGTANFYTNKNHGIIWGDPVAVFDLNEQADAARIEAGALAMAKRRNWNNAHFIKQKYLDYSRLALTAIGALSTPGKKFTAER
jgi:hypothetical protein